MSPLHQLHAKSALNKLKRHEPYHWDCNPYRGCQHGCVYCYARYSHRYLPHNDFARDIYVKEDFCETLEKELHAKGWKKEIINIGGVTDAYQPVEKKLKQMREILRICIKHENPVIVSTKSSLILRDMDLLARLAEKTYVNVAVSVITMDEELRKLVEPGASPAEERFEVLRQFQKTPCSRGLHLMPILPMLSDQQETLERIFREAALANVDYALSTALYLRGPTRTHYLKWVKNRLPSKYADCVRLYRAGKLDQEYKVALYQRIRSLRDKYGIGSDYMSILKERINR